MNIIWLIINSYDIIYRFKIFVNHPFTIKIERN